MPEGRDTVVETGRREDKPSTGEHSTRHGNPRKIFELFGVRVEMRNGENSRAKMRI